MGNPTFVGSFQKIIKKIQHLAFMEKVKIIKTQIPKKVKQFIDLNLTEETKFLRKNIIIKLIL